MWKYPNPLRTWALWGRTQFTLLNPKNQLVRGKLSLASLEMSHVDLPEKKRGPHLINPLQESYIWWDIHLTLSKCPGPKWWSRAWQACVFVSSKFLQHYAKPSYNANCLNRLVCVSMFNKTGASENKLEPPCWHDVVLAMIWLSLAKRNSVQPPKHLSEHIVWGITFFIFYFLSLQSQLHFKNYIYSGLPLHLKKKKPNSLVWFFTGL